MDQMRIRKSQNIKNSNYVLIFPLNIKGWSGITILQIFSQILI